MANIDIDIKRLLKAKKGGAQGRDWTTLESLLNAYVTAIGAGGDPGGSIALMNELRTDHETQVAATDATELLIEELAADHATFKTVVDDLKTLVNKLQAQTSNRVQVAGVLAIGTTVQNFQFSTGVTYSVGGVSVLKAATDNIAFSAAHVVSASKFGVILVQGAAAGVISTKVPAATQTYTSAALALAQLPAPDADNVALGYITIAQSAGGAFTANTTGLDDATTTDGYANAPAQLISLFSNPTAVATSSPATLGSPNPPSGPLAITAGAIATFAGAAVDTVTFTTNLS